jgi:hypothetical protein
MQRAIRDQLCTSCSAKNPPILRVQPGEPFVMETNDRLALIMASATPAVYF